MPAKTEQHFLVEVGRDGTMSLTEAGSLEPVAVGQELQTILTPFLRGL